MIKNILTNRDKLSIPCVPTTEGTPGEMMNCIKDLLDTAKHSNNCAGLAANQIGYNYRILVFKYDKRYKIIVDPEYLKRGGGKTTKKEGCLSVPGSVTKPVRVSRYKRIRIRYFNVEQSKWVENTFNNTNARVIQHEIDHLNGKLIGRG